MRERRKQPDTQCQDRPICAALGLVIFDWVEPWSHVLQFELWGLIQKNNQMFCFFIFQGIFVACMTAILRQMDDCHYNHYINTFKTRQDIIVSQLG